MNLDERDLKKIKSLHVMLKMPIWILEKETNKVLKSYESIYKHPISYGFKEKNISEETVQFYSGILNEIFLCLWYKDIKIVIGAFRINNVTRADFSHVYNNMDDENKKNLSETECWEYYEALPVYPLGDIRDYLILLGFLFDMDLEDIYSEGLHEQVAKNKLELEKKPSEEEVYDTFRVERYTFYYENKIMNLVSQGDIQLLKSGLTELGTSVLPILTSSSLKTEKKLYCYYFGKAGIVGDSGRKGYRVSNQAEKLLYQKGRRANRICRSFGYERQRDHSFYRRTSRCVESGKNIPHPVCSAIY